MPDTSVVDLSETSPVLKRSKVRQRSSPVHVPSIISSSSVQSSDVIELASDSEPDTFRHHGSIDPLITNPVDVSIISINTNSDEEDSPDNERDVHDDANDDDDMLPYEDENYFESMHQATLTYSPTSEAPIVTPVATATMPLVDPPPLASTEPPMVRPPPPTTRPTTKSSRASKHPKSTLNVALEASWSESDVAIKFKEALAAHTPKPIPVLPSIHCHVSCALLWEHSTAFDAALNRPVLTRVPMACRVFAALDFLAAMDARYAPIYDVIAGLRAHLHDPTARIFLVVEGMDKALIAEQRKQRATTVTFAHVQQACVQLFVNSFCHIKFTTDGDDTAQYLYSLTREVALLPQMEPVDFLTHVGRLTSLRATPNGDTTNELTNTWLRMLQMIPGMSEGRAQRVVGFYPTMQSLMTVYHNPAIPVEAKEVLLAEKLNANSIEIVLSKRIHAVFTCTDPSRVV
ncbi:hypothetical protein, variant 1 [Aphanomyces astaci]|nr:hypothetical protein, variant 1 [Aphanomyces astaci]ETV67626.1 hypothetical protein, variant 1 [Aphanomyces astaci]|eukprot:XP_009842883.1 hypothetical protein, variant 1 [Aphanomyces astaci]